MKRKNNVPKKGNNGFSGSKDSLFETEPKRKKNLEYDDEIVSESDDSVESESEKEEKEEEIETAAEKRLRIAQDHVDHLRRLEEKRIQDESESDEDENEGNRDSRVAQMLQKHHMEDTGRATRQIAKRVRKPETTDGFRILVKHRQTVTALVLSQDDQRGFSAAKDGSIVHWDVESGKVEKYLWPSNNVLKLHGAKDPQGKSTKHTKSVLALATSSDGRYLASGGVDRHVHLWDTRSREHIQAFSGHRGLVSCLAFREGSSELFSGSFDRTVKIWNVEDRAYVNTLFGHQSEVLTIDCLRKERALTVGRDRTMHLFKIPEESRLVFRAPASCLECCCFINNDEFLSGSDDGSIEHWTVLRKKPMHIVKNAHALVSPQVVEEAHEGLPNSLDDNEKQSSEFFSPAAQSWVSAVSLCRNSDLAASGAGNGVVRLWAIETDSKGMQPLFELPLVGFVNSLAFARSGKFLVAGVGQEPRLGRWGRISAARNGVAVHPLKLL